MKQFISSISLVVVLIALTTTGCEKEPEPFIGTWEIQIRHIVAYVDDVYLGDTTYYYDPGDLWIEFRADGTGTLHEAATYNYTFTWSLNGGIITYKGTNQQPLDFHYATNENDLTWYVTAVTKPYIKDTAKTYKEVWYHWSIRIN